VALTPKGAVEVADFQTAYDNSGNVTGEDGTKALSIEGKIGDIVRNAGFTLHYSGTRSFDERYRWQGNRFVLQGGKTQVPEC
jgi:hypothetical protein